jgi:FAD/FMN-containing dehydrogenase
VAERTNTGIGRGHGNGRAVLTHRGEPGYEEIRAGMLWNALTPPRYPEVIVRATSEDDVRDAVAYARDRGLRVTVRASGHSWCGAPLRDGGVLIDLSRLRGLSVDGDTATVQPGVTGGELMAALGRRDRAFPVAHRGSVALSGFVLSGGIGWNSRVWGPGCAGLDAIEAVTAAGETIRCSEHENPDLLWAARGAGPGFFAAVTSFRLCVRRLPPAIMTTRYVFPLADIAAVGRWTDRLTGAVPANVELSVALTTANGSGSPPVAAVTGTAFACTPREALRCLEPLRGCPIAGRALLREADRPTPFDVLFADADALWPPRRAAADSLWLNDDFATFLPDLADHAARAPSSESVVRAVLAPGGPARTPVPDMAFTPLGWVHVGCYALWSGRAADAANLSWLRATVAAAEPRAAGHHVADADLTAERFRARHSFTPAAWERLETLRARYDPEDVFESCPAPGRVPH